MLLIIFNDHKKLIKFATISTHGINLKRKEKFVIDFLRLCKT